jgi:hypothetical protein
MKAILLAGFCSLILVSLTLSAQSDTPGQVVSSGPVAGSTARGASSELSAKAHSQLFWSYGKIPLSFEVNRGQTDARVKFLSHGRGYSNSLTSEEAVFSLQGSRAKVEGNSTHPGRRSQFAELSTANAVLSMKWVKANPSANFNGKDERPGRSNYFVGNDPKKWSTNVTNYAKVKCEGVYSGIDLVYYGN